MAVNIGVSYLGALIDKRDIAVFLLAPLMRRSGAQSALMPAIMRDCRIVVDCFAMFHE
ncbi:hypothetical protein [Bifidobacterium cebidarum]|uniref:hypothetical protein n=1 Tax=Bifidobacterium cebidarum TaxID=2650773 RepID=UPI00186AE750|nr:hypothetical protein [Bifidobacterium cebidarum]